MCVSGGRRHALGGAGEAGRSPPWPIRRCWANGSAWGPVDGDIQCALVMLRVMMMGARARGCHTPPHLYS